MKNSNLTHNPDQKVKSVVLCGAMSVLAGTAMADAKPNPYLAPDDTWITLSGTVDSVSPDAFMLDYGEGVVTVEFDDGDRDADAYTFIDGDKVTVSGKVDDDVFELTSIEASSVFVESLNTSFFASAVDEESSQVLVSAVTIPVVPSSAVVQGKVAKVEDDSFQIDTGLKKVTVSVDEMVFNPLDDQGFLQVGKGDKVKVHAEMDADFFVDQELDATAIIKMNPMDS